MTRESEDDKALATLPEIADVSDSRFGPRAQGWLLPYVNPLGPRLGKEFFSSIPKVPGVYTMRGENREILYIGKAKNLRARLASYRRAQPDQVPRKVIRLIQMIRVIEWEECRDEEAALLRENHLLREHRPPFNVVNVNPESYYLIGVAAEGRWLRLRLTTQQDPQNGPQGELLFGAFKGRRSIREGYSALLRLVWACHSEMDRFGFPASLTRNRPRYQFDLRLKDDLSERETQLWLKLIRRFLNGTSRMLLRHLTSTLLEREDIPRFIYRCIQEDLETLEAFFTIGPLRNRRLKRQHGQAASHLIPQEILDDWLVLYRTRKARR